MSTASFEREICVPAGHPSLPGHFPGAPLAPGVLLLEAVAQALRAWRGERLARVVDAKFMAPLLPDERAQLSLHDVDGRVRFEIRRGDTLLARGSVEGAT
ncbi:hydroxymyristoyl-ACP dehydratase [Dyella solisilvae]|uniref:Hydroxymyristoyl-ACP dehydratase n=1 Tax=Dyella solisilvae TaxID=1920168 RepID=A0A370K8C4_9GAMM|nr:hydroxymyristoyl-ACP dehydratase [Dyella solisilvae]RDI98885.1 hydroxymyristoyl-ACP dehydratase [Dyella solisilvae]